MLQNTSNNLPGKHNAPSPFRMDSEKPWSWTRMIRRLKERLLRMCEYWQLWNLKTCCVFKVEDYATDADTSGWLTKRLQ